MPTDLAQHIQSTKVIDTHEHMWKEKDWIETGQDVLSNLFSNYIGADWRTAGASPEAIERLHDGQDDDLEGRWEGVADVWPAIKFTGYGESVRLAAKGLYDIDEITPQTVRAAQPKYEQFLQPGGRLHVLRDLAGLEMIQTDDFLWSCLPDASGPDFFFYDLSWWFFSTGGEFDRGQSWETLADETGVTIKDLSTLCAAMESVFDKYAGCAVAVKTQHAYNRTLRWVERTDAEAEVALQRVLRGGDDIDVQTRLCLGDWSLARGAELARQYNLPLKIHCGYYAGNDRMPVDFIKPGNLCPLLAKYLDTQFVLMHIAYPYEDELIALSKHYRNVWPDMCWAWSINPAASAAFVRRFIHAAPINKMFVFGGDTNSPTGAYGYTAQMRRWLTRALQAEVDQGDLTEPEAIAVASQIMRENQLDCFDVEGTSRAIREAQQKMVSI